MNSQQAVILVTGSSGLLGSAVIRRFAGHFRLVGFDREGSPHPPPAAECVCVDLTSEESVQLGLNRVRHGYGQHLASVIHLAAYYDFSGEPSPKYDEITVRQSRPAPMVSRKQTRASLMARRNCHCAVVGGIPCRLNISTLVPQQRKRAA